MAKTDLTAQRLRELLDYNPNSGEFIRRVRTGPTAPAGCLAGYIKASGYVYISVDGHHYLAHRLAWLYTHGMWPTGVIDHVDGNCTDNRIFNLRDVSVAENTQNMRKGRVNSAVSYLGVSVKRKKWRASIRSAGKTINLGVFNTPELAHEAYVAAKRKLHRTCTI